MPRVRQNGRTADQHGVAARRARHMDVPSDIPLSFGFFRRFCPQSRWHEISFIRVIDDVSTLATSL